MIALSSALLTRALFPGLPPVVTAASLASTPFKPFLVTTGNALALEGKFLHRALQNPGVCVLQGEETQRAVVLLVVCMGRCLQVAHWLEGVGKASARIRACTPAHL